MSSFKAVHIVLILIALCGGYFLGKKHNPKPAKVIIKKVTEEKTIQKQVKYDVVVEKIVNDLPNFVRVDGEEIDCDETEKIKLMPAKSKWPVNRFEDSEVKKTFDKVDNAMFAVTKHMLIKKIHCRNELNPDELELLIELVRRQDKLPEVL